MPTHWILSHKVISAELVDVELKESDVKTITTQININAKDRATRSRKLKVKANNRSEKAVIDIPADKIWLIVRSNTCITTCHPSVIA
jgi:hypothetical protein